MTNDDHDNSRRFSKIGFFPYPDTVGMAKGLNKRKKKHFSDSVVRIINEINVHSHSSHNNNKVDSKNNSKKNSSNC